MCFIRLFFLSLPNTEFFAFGFFRQAGAQCSFQGLRGRTEFTSPPQLFRLSILVSQTLSIVFSWSWVLRTTSGQHPRCESELGCVRQPTFGWEGEKARYCSAHKVEGMLDVKVRPERVRTPHNLACSVCVLCVPGAIVRVWRFVLFSRRGGGRMGRRSETAGRTGSRPLFVALLFCSLLCHVCLF